MFMAAGGHGKKAIAVIVRKAEALVFLQLSTSLTAEDEALFDLIHGLSEAAVVNWLQQNVELTQTVEYLPIGQPAVASDPLLQSNYASPGSRGNSLGLSRVEFRSSTAAFVSNRGGGEMLQLKNTPVLLTGLQVKEDVGAYAGQAEGAFGDDTLLELGADYYLDVDDAAEDISTSGLLYRCSGVWPSEPRSIKAVYWGGYSASQLKGSRAGALKLAIMKVIRANFFEAKTVAKSGGLGPALSESIGKYSVSYGSQWLSANFSASIPASVMQDLFSFRNLGRTFG